jgi:hypothetical protein
MTDADREYAVVSVGVRELRFGESFAVIGIPNAVGGIIGASPVMWMVFRSWAAFFLP